jgi:hypothetical protein
MRHSYFTTPEDRRVRAGAFWLVGLGVFWAGSYFVARAALETFGDLPEPARLAIAAAPLATFLAFFFAFLGKLRAADEMHRQVQLEALAIAYPLAVAFFMALGLADLVVAPPALDLSYRHTWYLLPLFYFIGLAFAWRRRR